MRMFSTDRLASLTSAARQTTLASRLGWLLGGCAALLCLVMPIAAVGGSAPATPDPAKLTTVEGPVAVKIDARAPADNAAGCNFAGAPDAAEGEAIIRAVARDESFPQDMLVSIARQESGFRMNEVSSAGAVGLMQLMPDTARRFQVDICDPKDNVRGAIRFLRVLQKKYDNPIYMLAAYNAGEGVVDQNRGVPLYPETVHFVAAILTDLYGWKPLRAAGAMASSPAPADLPGGEPKKPVDGERHPPSESWSQGFVLHVE
jgi:hypothetical protein